MEGMVLVIKGKRYSWSNLQELPQNLSTHTVSSMQSPTHYGFFGELNPLSNFHPAVFNYEGLTYISSEQLIQAMKAKFCDNQDSLGRIMASKSPLECKILGKGIKNCNISNWNRSAKELCYPGILAKFQQNPGLAVFLKNTGNKTIVECCYDDTWGNGLPLSNPMCVNPKSYKKQGILGEMLESIRDVLSSETKSSSVPAVDNTMDEGNSLPVQT